MIVYLYYKFYNHHKNTNPVVSLGVIGQRVNWERVILTLKGDTIPSAGDILLRN